MPVRTYIQPKTLPELGKALERMTDGSKVIAGGTDLMLEIREKDPEIPVLVDLSKVPDLKGIRLEDTPEGQVLVIGATTCHADVAASELVRKYANALSMSCGCVGSRQVRNRGTVGGSLGNASAAGDILPVLVLLHASVTAAGPDGTERRIPAEEFQKSIGKTALGGKEIVSEVRIPVRKERQSCFVKLGGRHEVTIAEISLSLSWTERDGCIADVEGVLGAVDVRPVLLSEADAILGQGSVGAEECDRLAESLSGRIREIRRNRKRPPKLRIREGEKEFKERAVKGVVYDAVEKMQETAKQGRK